MSGRIEVRESSIEGVGVYAATAFDRGDVVLQIDDSRIVDDAHPLLPGECDRHCDYLAAGAMVLMQYPERHINHSCDPNVYVRTTADKRCVVALRNIPAGQEIAYDYCINGYGNTIWTCHCGSARCRRSIHSDFFHLPLELQEDYLPLLDSWFLEERAAEVNHLLQMLASRQSSA